MEGYISKMARVYAAMFRVEEDDLRQVGWMSALHHAKRFDESKVIGFYGYSHRGIAFKMRQEAVRNFHQVTRSWDAFFETRIGGMSLDQPLSHSGDGVNVDAIFGAEDSVLPPLLEAETHEVVRQALERLPRRLRDVLHYYYFADIKVHEAEKALGLSREWLRQLRMEGLKRLRNSKTIRALAA